MSGKIVWREGMFIRPQHFQQQERYFLNELNTRIRSTSKFDWGLMNLVISQTDLDSGRFGLEECRAVFVDGTTYHSPSVDPLPTSIHISDSLSDAIVYLVIPERKLHSSEIGSFEQDAAPFRYTTEKLGVTDNTSNESQPQTIEFGKLQCRLMIEERNANSSDNGVPEGFLKLAIAHIQEVVGGRVKLNKSFIPVVLYIDVSDVLSDTLAEFRATLHVRANEIAGRVSGRSYDGSVATNIDLLCLQTINRTLPLIEQFMGLGYIHPQRLYEFLLALSGELSTYLSDARRPMNFELYNHERLNACFDPLIDSIKSCLSVVLDKAAIKLDLSPPMKGIRGAKIASKSMLQEGYLVLAVKANVDEEVIQHQFPAQAKIASVEQIQTLVNSSLPGIKLIHRPQVPPEIPFISGFIYFELSKQGEMWNELLNSNGLTIHIGENFPGLELQLWSIRNK